MNYLMYVPDVNDDNKLALVPKSLKFESLLTQTESAMDESPVPKLFKATSTDALARDHQSDNSSCLSNAVLSAHDKSMTESTDHNTHVSHNFSEKALVIILVSNMFILPFKNK